MRKILFAGTAVLFIGLAAAPVQAQDEVDWQVLPAEKEALVKLDREQVRALRNSVRHCDDLARSNHRQTACVFLDLDRVMRQSEDAALKAYHFALPRGLRYDEKRNEGFAAERVLKMRAQALE
ncbi:MAG: hypothetical protein AMXMBFR74_17210 [Parvibaculum sp.]|uniref:hypothetical protein n=1 Tax=Parvibaculum sp. TaxID=2024848 RepID=UPI0035BA0E57